MMLKYGPEPGPFNNYRQYLPPPKEILPKLEHLTSLSIAKMGFRDRGLDLEKQRVVILSLLKTYGGQLTRFGCDTYLFTSGLGMDLVSSLLPNIKTLEIEGINNGHRWWKNRGNLVIRLPGSFLSGK